MPPKVETTQEDEAAFQKRLAEYDRRYKESTIFHLVKSYRTIGLTLSEMEIIAHIFIQQHEQPDERLTIGSIAEALNKNHRTIQKHLRDIEAKGLVTIRHQHISDGGQDANDYDISEITRRLLPLPHLRGKP